LGSKVDASISDFLLACESVRKELQNRRYLTARVKLKRRKPKFENFLETDTDDALSDRDFLFHFRVTRERFSSLLQLIQHHQVFQSLDQKGRPAVHQLLVLLKYYGSQGNGGSDISLSTFFGVGAGTIQDYRDRALEALLSLEEKAYFWPKQLERQQTARRIQQQYYFPNCVGFIDGTLLPLEFKPVLHGENYLSRKKFYAITMLIVCDDLCRILYYHIGWPGSVHDNRVWRTCKLNCKSPEFFSDKEYLLGDSAFTPSMILVPSFKCLAGQGMTADQTEHFIGSTPC
jgi:hypothetical protein